MFWFTPVEVTNGKRYPLDLPARWNHQIRNGINAALPSGPGADDRQAESRL